MVFFVHYRSVKSFSLNEYFCSGQLDFEYFQRVLSVLILRNFYVLTSKRTQNCGVIFGWKKDRFFSRPAKVPGMPLQFLQLGEN